MSARLLINPRLSKHRLTLYVLRFSFSIILLLVSCVIIAQAQMRPMSNVTVGQRETETRQPQPPAANAQEKPAKEVSTRAASTAGTSTTSTSTQETSTRVKPAPEARALDTSTQPAPARETPARRETSPRNAAARETLKTVKSTRARRVSSQPASNLDQAESELKGITADESEDAGGAKTLSLPAARMNADEPPPMTAEAKGTDRLSTLRAQIDDAQDDGERARLQRTLVDYLVSLDRKHDAVAELRSMMRAERFDPVGFYNIGNALARLGDTDTAMDAYRKAITQRHGNYSRALNNLGVLLLRQERFDEAYETLTGALRLENYRYAEASYNLGRLYTARGETGLAIAEWRRTLILQPDHSEAALALARAYAEDGNPQFGLQVLDKFTARFGPSQAFMTARQQLLLAASPAPVQSPGK